MIFIWFSEEDYGQTVTDPLIQTTRVDSNTRQSSGMTCYTSLRVLTFTEQNNKWHKNSMNTNWTIITKGSRQTGSKRWNQKCKHTCIIIN
jgi:hypothetical protein